MGQKNEGSGGKIVAISSTWNPSSNEENKGKKGLGEFESVYTCQRG